MRLLVPAAWQPCPVQSQCSAAAVSDLFTASQAFCGPHACVMICSTFLQGDEYNLAIEYSCGWAVPGVWMKSVDLGFGRMRDLTRLTGRAQIMSLA